MTWRFASFADPGLLRHPFTRELWHALPEHDFAVGEGAGGKGQEQACEGEKESASEQVREHEKASSPVPAQVREGEETPTPASAGAGGFDGKEGGAC